VASDLIPKNLAVEVIKNDRDRGEIEKRGKSENAFIRSTRLKSGSRVNVSLGNLKQRRELAFL